MKGLTQNQPTPACLSFVGTLCTVSRYSQFTTSSPDYTLQTAIIHMIKVLKTVISYTKCYHNSREPLPFHYLRKSHE